MSNTRRTPIGSDHRLLVASLLTMAPQLTFLWLGLAWLAAFGHTYGIDSSCEDIDFIQRSADAAIAMAQGALDELMRTPVDPNVDRLIGLLFRPADTASGPNDDVIIENMKDVYEGVLKFQGKTDLVRPGSSEASAEQVVCSKVRSENGYR